RWKIPWRERRDHADGLLHDELAHAFDPTRHDPSIGTPAFLGKPFDNVGADEHLGAGFGNDLALLLRHQARDILRALAYQTCRLAQHLRAVIGACRAPDRKALIRGLERLVEVA